MSILIKDKDICTYIHALTTSVLDAHYAVCIRIRMEKKECMKYKQSKKENIYKTNKAKEKE